LCDRWKPFEGYYPLLKNDYSNQGYKQTDSQVWKYKKGVVQMTTKLPGTTIFSGELEDLLRETATPIDLEGLEQAGVLEKRGNWYAILNFSELPSHAKNKIKSVKQNKKKEVLVKFQAVSKKTQKLFNEYASSNNDK
jgi:hypothetical protein